MNTATPENTDSHYLEAEFRDLMSDPATSFFLDEDILDGFWFRDLTAPANEWLSPRFWRSLGFDPSLRSHLAQERQDLIFPQDARAARVCLERHCEDPNVRYDQLVRYHAADGGTVIIRCRGKAIRKDGVPTRMLGVHTVVHDSRNQEIDRQVNKLVEKSGDAIVVWSAQDGIIRWNEGATHLYGFSEGQADGAEPNALTNAEYEGGWKGVEGQLDNGREWSGDVLRTRADGTACVTSSRLQKLVVSGERALILQIDRDVSKRHAEDEKQAFLDRELNHRFKNLFSVIQGLVGLSSRHETNVRQFGEKITARIKALATAHLLGMEDQGEGEGANTLDMHDLVSVILSPYLALVDGFSCEGEVVHVPKRIVNPLALILHELATNAVKHGAWAPAGQGKILITWQVKSQNSDELILEMNWRETLEGTDMPPEIHHNEVSVEGFGSKLIEMSVRQLGGTLVRNWLPTGFFLRLSFVIDEQVA